MSAHDAGPFGPRDPQPEPLDLRYHDVAEVSRGLGDCMPGLDVRSMTGAEAAPGFTKSAS